MPTVEYQDDKYFRLMMLSLLIHDFIHDYGAISALNRIKSLEEISQIFFKEIKLVMVRNDKVRPKLELHKKLQKKNRK